MKLVIGLGNPEKRYDSTRHNVGFFVLDHVAAVHGGAWKHSDKFRAELAEISLQNEKLLLVKPTTYYNLVGEAARSLMVFYKLTPEDVLVIHDDLALPLGTIRTRLGGSDGGNNGLKSIAAHLGPDTARLRIGVWTDHHHGADKTSVVLGRFSREEQSLLASQLPTIERIIEDFIAGGFTVTTHR